MKGLDFSWPVFLLFLGMLFGSSSIRGASDSTHHFEARIPFHELGESFKKVELLLHKHPQWSYRDLQKHNPAQAAWLSRQPQMKLSVNKPGAEPPLGIPASIWGYCLMPVGVGIVYLDTKDPTLTKEAARGCMWSGILIGGFLATAAAVSFFVSARLSH